MWLLAEFDTIAKAFAAVFPTDIILYILKLLFNSLCNYLSLILFLEAREVHIYLFFAHLIILKLLQTMRLVNEVLELFKLWELRNAVVEKPP
jgi:hypothetical protein